MLRLARYRRLFYGCMRNPSPKPELYSKKNKGSLEVTCYINRVRLSKTRVHFILQITRDMRLLRVLGKIGFGFDRLRSRGKRQRTEGFGPT